MPYVEYDEVEAICSDCGMMFRSEEALVAHRVEAHEGTESRAAAPTPPEIRCEHCQRTFKSGAGRARHMARRHPSS
jgi:uncharacterized C2H2 Zn-finger protein